MKTLTIAQRNQITTRVLFHLLILAAPFTFTWQGFALGFVLVYVTGWFGIVLGFHRLLSHQSFKTHPWVKNTLMFLGALAYQGDPCWWVLNHRLHHQEADTDADPHSPKEGFWWAQIIWVFSDDSRWRSKEAYERYVPDLIHDPLAKFLRHYILHVNIAFLLLTFGVGYVFGGLKLALSFLVWGGFIRLFYVWHTTGFVNSLCHMWGSRRYDTRDNSRNLWWLAVLSQGDGWHNNHHASPSTARHGHRWWEIDMTYWLIQLMAICGLAWDVNTRIPSTTEASPAP